jgi:plasmid stability protein
MAQLIVRDLDEDVVTALKARAARNGRSAEAEHRRILEAALRGERDMAAYADAAARLRARFRSRLDSTQLIRAARDERAG